MRFFVLGIWCLTASTGFAQSGLKPKAPDTAVPEWRYVPSTVDNSFSRPVSRSFTMTLDPPDDVEVEAIWRGTKQWYSQVRYGNEASVRVTIVVDETAPSEFDVYVDRNRDRIIESVDLLEGEGREREFDLICEVAQEEFVSEYLRRVQFRRSISGNQFSLGTVGFVEGTASRNNVPTPVRLVDGDVNGLFADDRDRIWINLINDGIWNALNEQFPFRPMLILDEKRWAVRADRIGSRFHLEEVNGVGELRLTLTNLPASAKVISFSGMVYAEDGSAYSMPGLDKPLTVPVGRYTPQSVTVAIDCGEPDPWYFSFSRSNTPNENDWFTITAEGQTNIEAIGTLRFVAGVDTGKTVRAGSAIQLRPRLYTSHGLLINMSCRSQSSDSTQAERFHNPAIMSLQTADGMAVANGKSGFA